MSSIKNHGENRNVKEHFKQRIFTVDALAGAGKTYQALQWAIKKAKKGEKILFIQPTKDLIDQSCADAQAFAAEAEILIKKIHGDAKSVASVVGEVVEFLKASKKGEGTILFITHVTFLSIPYFHNQGEWIAICDEVFNVLDRVSRNLRDNFYLILDLVDRRNYGNFHTELIEKKHNPENMDSVQLCKNRLRQIAENRYGDDISEILQPFAKAVLAKGHRALIKNEILKCLESKRTEKSGSEFIIYDLIEPSVFKKFKTAIVMSALFNSSQLASFWDGKVRFQKFKKIQKKLRYAKHQNQGKIIFKYFYDGAWTQNFYSNIQHGKRVLDHYVDAIKSEMTNKSFLYLANKNFDLKFENCNAEMLPSMSHGLNCYQHIDHVAFLSALHLTPDAYLFCKTQGITADQVEASTMLLACYQAIMRSSLRDPDCTNPHVIIVPTRDLAEQLSKYFLNSEIAQLDNVPEFEVKNVGRPKKLISDPGYIRERKRKRRKELINPVLRLNNIDVDTDENTLINNRFYVTNSKKTLFPITLYAYPGKKSIEALTYTVESETSLESDLKFLHARIVEAKDSNFLISPAVFKSNVGRKKDDIDHCWCLMLDVDGGTMSPEDLNFALAGIKKFCFSTFSGEKNRYRVLIPISHRLTPNAYEDAFQSIIKIVERYLRKYGSKNADLNTNELLHKIDPCSKYPTQLYYAPCKPDQSANSGGFFKTFPGEILDVVELLFRPQHDYVYGPKIRGPKKNELILHPTAAIEKRIEEYKSDYKSVPKGEDKRNSAFFGLALRLSYLALSHAEIEGHLNDANYDKSRDVKGVMRQLAKPSYQPKHYDPLVYEEIKKRA